MRLTAKLCLLPVLPLFSPLAAMAAPAFSLTSSDVSAAQPIANTYVFKGFGCAGDNRSPALSWKGAPEGTKSFAVTVYDPDAPTGSGWWHWVVIDLPATTQSLATGAGEASGAQLPKGAQQIRTDFGAVGYGGPCPPPGDAPHHYVFTVYALKTDHLEVPADATAALTGFMIHANTLGSATFTARYGR